MDGSKMCRIWEGGRGCGWRCARREKNPPAKNCIHHRAMNKTRHPVYVYVEQVMQRQKRGWPEVPERVCGMKNAAAAAKDAPPFFEKRRRPPAHGGSVRDKMIGVLFSHLCRSARNPFSNPERASPIPIERTPIRCRYHQRGPQEWKARRYTSHPTVFPTTHTATK